MGRVFLTIVIPLLLPTVLYMVARATTGKPLDFSGMWVWLAVAGVALVALTLIAISVDFGDSKSGRYVPPHVSGDSVVPGRIDAGPSNPGPAR